MRILFFILSILLISPGVIKAQGSGVSKKMDSMFIILYNDTSDSEDFEPDTSLSTQFLTPSPCKDKIWEYSDKKINLCNENPYLLIFNDEFQTFDENMWFKKNAEGSFDWDYWNTDKPGFDICEDLQAGQQIYLRKNVYNKNNFLAIKTNSIGFRIFYA